MSDSSGRWRRRSRPAGGWPTRSARSAAEARAEQPHPEVRDRTMWEMSGVGRVSRTTFGPRVRQLAAAVPALSAVIDPLLSTHGVLRKSFAELNRQVLALTPVDPVCRRLMSVPGVGAVTALAYCSAVDITERCARSKAVGAHFGLMPRKHQSGTSDRNGRITKAGAAMVRTALFEAANVLLTRVARWSPLEAWAVRLAQRIGGKRAKVALARKLAVILHRIWIDGTTFAWSDSRRRYERPAPRGSRFSADVPAGTRGLAKPQQAMGNHAAFQIGSPRRSDVIMWRQRPTR